VDDRFAENWRAVGETGLRRGAYHFFTLRRAGSDQAANFLHTAPPDPQALQPVVDLEFAGNSSDRPGRESLLKELGEFLDRVEGAWGRPCVFYLADDFEDYYHVVEVLPRQRWVTGLRRPQTPWLIWQANQLGRLPGIAGTVDVDVMKP
jgi:lysozyme